MKKIISITIILLLAVSVRIQSQKPGVRFDLSGKVTDAATNTPLQNASIYISDLRIGTNTDANGNYHLHNLPTGTYLVEVGFVGYNNVIKNVTLTQNITLDFVMDISIKEVNEVVVTGASKATSIRRNPI